jgi:pimeloyl-ACP methyl ester carboxylesterase
MRKLVVTILSLASAATLCVAFVAGDWTNKSTVLRNSSGQKFVKAEAPSPARELRGGGTSGHAFQISLTPCHVQDVKEELRCGVYNVFENRRAQTGRKLPLKIVVIPARHPHPDQGPVFYMAGGPGEAATELVDLVMSWGDAEEHDVVMVDERGTGDGHRLNCKSPGSDDKLEAYLNGPFDADAARVCREELSREFDLTQYTTPNFADDIDEVRAAMGYDKININAGSFGTYAAHIYMRRHGEHVRTAYLSSLVCLSARVPLYFARSTQSGFDQLLKDCEQDGACHTAYPRLREDFAAVLKRVRARPVTTFVKHPVSGARTEIHLTERMFADAVRVMMYREKSAHEVPFLVEKAVAGDFSPFAEAGLRANRGIYTGGNMGLFYCITCNEFVRRINPEEIEPATNGYFLGSWRVRAQMAACKEWPKTGLPNDYFAPFRIDLPTVLVSGAADVASPPIWGEEVKKFIPNALNIVIPGGAHTPENSCTRAIRHQLFSTGTTRGIDTNCIQEAEHAPFKLPSGGSETEK